MDWHRRVTTSTKVTYAIDSGAPVSDLDCLLSKARAEWRHLSGSADLRPTDWAHAVASDGEIRIVFEIESTEPDPKVGP